MGSRPGSATGLTENNVHNWVGEAQYNRGLQYVYEGLVVPRSHRGSLVSGWCLPRNGQAQAYYVWGRFRGLRICDAHCTCALGKYGICPHVAAVMVGFIRCPEQFRRTLWQRFLGMFQGHKAVALPPLPPRTTPVRPNQVA